MTLRPLAAGRRLAARTPLQAKLIVAVLALVTVALALIGLASVAALEGYLVGRLDDQLQSVARRSADQGPPQLAGPGPPRKGPPSPFLVQYRLADGTLDVKDENPLEEGQQPPQVPDDPAWFAANAREATTVPATGATAAGGSPSSRPGTATAWWWRPAWTRSTAPPASSG